MLGTLWTSEMKLLMAEFFTRSRPLIIAATACLYAFAALAGVLTLATLVNLIKVIF